MSLRPGGGARRGRRRRARGAAVLAVPRHGGGRTPTRAPVLHVDESVPDLLRVEIVPVRGQVLRVADEQVAIAGQIAIEDREGLPDRFRPEVDQDVSAEDDVTRLSEGRRVVQYVRQSELDPLPHFRGHLLGPVGSVSDVLAAIFGGHGAEGPAGVDAALSGPEGSLADVRGLYIKLPLIGEWQHFQQHHHDRIRLLARSTPGAPDPERAVGPLAGLD